MMDGYARELAYRVGVFSFFADIDEIGLRESMRTQVIKHARTFGKDPSHLWSVLSEYAEDRTSTL
jgi:hypothetical protein